ncbi:PBECR4 domain-containing protein [Limosilactobacillus mucosae]|jgi:hypothetical protein|uniref:Phage-Barnase-EndoU-ColicinE5/D-RelE like nuclease 4 domain-containing protein n=1 Tax=Limosilactobacillus mucosae LM1 TaxID=1130798 RepID=A0A0D4CL22_LIMMU|nr:PBECR4 domain-containing protein [Limosilactobacillus mucosae]AJT50610.1 hypothetical protein LBLM1_05890 [Limosilactobacillus mucosae LM1]
MTIYNNSSTDPSFQMTYVEKTRQVAGYHVATDEDLTGLNKYADTLVNVAQFYRRNLAFGRIIYLVKQDDQIKALPVRFGKENFAHLTGVVFDRKKASQMLDEIADGKLSQNAIFVKNDGTTFEKLAKIDEVMKITDSNVVELSRLSAFVEQAKKLNFNKAIKPSDEALLALKQVEPKIYRPYSLINLQTAKNSYSDYSNVPENEVLAVLSLTRNQLKGFSIGTLSINSEYVKDGRQLMELTTKTRQILLKEYVAMQTRRKLATKQQNKTKKKGRER